MKTSKRPKVLVLGNDERAFLSVVRSLGRQGIEVHAGCADWNPIPNASKYISRIHVVPNHEMNPDWKNTIIELMRSECFDLVIPCNDQAIVPLQVHRKEFETHGNIYLLSEKAFDVAFDKIKSWELAKTLGIGVPKGYVVHGAGDIDRILADFHFPVVLKPRASHTSRNLSRKNEVYKAHDKDELSKHLKSMETQGDVLVQENFIGTGVGVELLADKGSVLVALQHIRVHEPLKGGGSSYRKTVPLDPELLEAATKLMEALDYTGVAMVEFKCNDRTGEWIFIEINGRFWGSLPLAIAAGADFPLYLFQLLVEGKKAFSRHYETNLYCRNISRDLEWFVENLKAPRNDATLSVVPLVEVLKEFRNIVTFRERYDTLTWDDARPGIAELRQVFGRIYRKISNRLRWNIQSLPPFRSVHARKLRSAVEGSRSILFVCKGNICRSPFAEHYFRTRYANTYVVSSAGYYKNVGRKCPREAVDVASEYGVFLESHRSRVVDERLIREADVVFTFDEENFESLETMFPDARTKVYPLGYVNDKGSVDIADPFGGSRKDFQETYSKIARSINALQQ